MLGSIETVKAHHLLGQFQGNFNIELMKTFDGTDVLLYCNYCLVNKRRGLYRVQTSAVWPALSTITFDQTLWYQEGDGPTNSLGGAACVWDTRAVG